MTACSGLSVVLVMRNCGGRAENSLTKTGVVGSASNRRSPLSFLFSFFLFSNAACSFVTHLRSESLEQAKSRTVKDKPLL